MTKKLKLNGLKAHTIALSVLFFSSILMNPLYAQTAGETCGDPITIETLPFNDSGNTADYGNDYTQSDVAPIASGAVTDGSGAINYLDGPEVVYAITPVIDGTISISTTNADDWVGLWVFTGCPFSSTVGYHTSTSGSTRSISNLPVTADETYYIIISSWPSQLANTDFTIEIEGSEGLLTPLEDCTDADAGSIVGVSEVCEGINFSLTTENSSASAGGLNRQWQSSIDGENWTDIEGATGANLNTSIAEDTYFRFTISCEISEEEDVTDAFLVELKAVNECYCIPGGTNASYYINNFSTTGGVENIENLGSGHALDGYGDYFDTHLASQVRTEEINFHADYEGSNFGAKIWVDWNQDGQFSDDEIVYQSSSYEYSHSGSFEVPESAELGVTRMRIGISYTPNTGPNDPCESGSREFEDYAFEVLPLEDCEGTPTAGTVESEMQVCSGIAFTLSTEGASLPADGLTRIWQSSPAGEEDWTDLEGSNSSDFVLQDGITEDTDFRYTVNCSNSDESDISEVIEVTLKPAIECYCIPGGTNANYYINNFSTTGGVENIENLGSGYDPNGYGDYFDTHLASQVRTEEINFQADYASGYTFGTKIWVDWNQDGQFSDDEIVYQSSSYTSAASGSFEVPESAELGVTRMRIGISYTPSSGPDSPCDIGSREFEDYAFEVLPLEDCEGTPTAGTVETEMQVCSGIAFTLSTEGSSAPADGLERIWQSSPAGEEDWTDLEGSNSSDFVLQDGITEDTDFRYTVHCTNSDESDISEVIEVTLKPAEECYCIPSTNSTSYYPNSFSTTNGEENINNTVSSAPSNGYGDFTDQKVKQIKTLSVDFSSTMSASTAGMKIWVDWNKDGIFDSDEIVYQSSSYLADHSGTITVPEGAIDGETIMRVGTNYLGIGGPTTPCEESTSTYVAYQDYTFEVVPLEDCEGTPDAGIVETELSVCSGIDFHLITENASSPANNLVRTWQSSPAGEDDWTDIDDSHFSDFVVSGGISEATDFRFKLQCGDGDIVYSDVIEVTLKPANECYCTPLNTSSSTYYISNVSTNGALQDIDNTSTFSENGYADYTDSSIITVYPGQVFDYSIAGSNSSMKYEVWLDVDQNGNFDGPLDHIISSGGSYVGTPFAGTFEVPSDIEEGDYRLRIRASWSASILDPCSNNNYGETEDYTVQVIYPDCFPPVDVEINYITDNSAQVTWEGNNESEWEVIYGETGFDPETEGESVTVTEPLADLIDLQDDTTYQVYVRTLCDTDNSVLIGPKSFTTNITPPVNTRLCDAIELIPNSGCVGGPYTNVAAFQEAYEPVGSCLNDFHGTNTVWFTFVATDTEAVVTTDFNSTDFSTEIVIYEAPDDCTDMNTLGEEVGCANAGTEGILNLTDLTIGNTYYVQIAGFNNAEGLFCLEVQMDETEICLDPTEVTIGEITDTTVEVSWTSNGSATQWEVLYGWAGFDIDTEGESMIVNSTETTLIDLQPETDYEVYVRAICGDDNSNWAGPQTFTTDEMGIENQIFKDFSFYPNPVKELLNLKAGSLIEKVEIYNLLGQKVLEVQPNHLESAIDTDKLQSGTYLMNVTIEGINKSFKVIKK